MIYETRTESCLHSSDSQYSRALHIKVAIESAHCDCAMNMCSEKTEM